MQVNNNQKLREALELCDKIMSDVVTGVRYMSPLEAFEEMGGIIDKALAPPPRNCDLFDSHIADDEFEKAMRFPPSKTADERDELMRENWYLFKLWLYAEAKGEAK